jgi:hypothetical protein
MNVLRSNPDQGDLLALLAEIRRERAELERQGQDGGKTP